MNKIKELARTSLFLCGRALCNNNLSKIVYYHDVSSISGGNHTTMSTPITLFMAHMDILRKYGVIVDAISEPKGQFQIAFDDGFKGLYENREYFINNQIHPTIFVANNLIGSDNYMDESQIKELSALGFVFQSHTVSHCDLTKLGLEDLRRELKESKEYLESLIGQEVFGICCPMGYYNDLVIEEAEKVGYRKIYLSYPSPFTVGDLTTGRYLCQSLNIFQFKLLLHGGMDILKPRYIKQHYKFEA